MFAAVDDLALAQQRSIAWQFLLAARNSYLANDIQPGGLTFDLSMQEVVAVDSSDPSVALCLDRERQWQRAEHLPGVWQTLFDLYLPILGGIDNSVRVVAHLGQSLDSRIATSSGDSFFVTGEENRKHLHCLRALSDAVIIGAGTALADNPQLTTRAVPGSNPVRIIIDPRARVEATLGICCDAQARTILLHQSSTDLSGKNNTFGPMLDCLGETPQPQVERWVVPHTADLMSPRAIVKFLGSQGLKRLFVEGGGITVSKFFEDSALHRLHVAVAPLLVGNGTPALQLAGSATMKNAHRPPHAIYRMGEDVLWDFDVDVGRQDRTESMESQAAEDSADGSLNSVERIA